LQFKIVSHITKSKHWLSPGGHFFFIQEQTIMKHLAAVLALSLAWITVSTPAYAYLDPGVGSMVLQSMVAGLAGGATLIAMYVTKLKAKFAKRSGPASDEKSAE
jgi:multisubunit Na+/H+ antiporter MnhB subunit